MNKDTDVSQYRKITGIRTGGISLLSGRYRLYAGNDHFLQVRKMPYSETYRRFFFSDIQAISLSRTNSGFFTAGILCFLAAYFGLLAILGYVLPYMEVLIYIGGICCGISLVILMVHVALGPTCKCHVYTAVQREPLMALARINQAKRTVALMEAAIREAQGPLDVVDAEAGPGRILRPAAHRRADNGSVRRPTAAQVRREMTVFFWLLVFNGVIPILGLVGLPGMLGLSWVLYGLTCVCIIVMETRQIRVALTRRLTNLALMGTLCLLGALVMDVTFKVILSFAQAMLPWGLQGALSLGFSTALLIVSVRGLATFSREKRLPPPAPQAIPASAAEAEPVAEQQ